VIETSAFILPSVCIGEFRDIAHPINSEMRQEIQDAVMKVYDETDEVIPDKNASSDHLAYIINKISIIKNMICFLLF
jgi:hypothetical protein